MPDAAGAALPADLVLGRSFMLQPSRIRFVEQTPDAREPLLIGRRDRVELQRGLSLYRSQVRDLRDLVTRVEIEAGISIAILLDGTSDISIDGTPILLSAGEIRGAARAAVVALGQSLTYERRWHRGRFERKLVIDLSPAWLETQGLASTRPRLAVHRWRPSPRAIALAEQLLAVPVGVDGLDRLAASGRALELIGEALAGTLHAGAEAPPARPLSPRVHARLTRVRDFLASREGDGVAVGELARIAGLSTTTLQRQFRAAFGTTIRDYRRELSLERARAALEQDGLTVAQAASIAGYQSPANFATAFRRRFGLAPRQVLGRV